MIEQIRIIIADDHPLFREGTRRTLSEFSDFEVVAECANGDEAVEAANEFQPDIILLDISMPGGGVNAARRITIALPEVRIVMLTVSERESDVINLMNVGATGYVSKGIAREEFAAVIKTIHEGEIYVSPSLSRDGQIPGDWLDSDEDSDLLELLTMREE